MTSSYRAWDQPITSMTARVFRDPLQLERHGDAAAPDPAEDVERGRAAAVAHD